jgi:hypothetical protein
VFFQVKGALVVGDEKIEYPEAPQHYDVFGTDKGVVFADKLTVNIVSVHSVCFIQVRCSMARAPAGIKMYHESPAVSNIQKNMPF